MFVAKTIISLGIVIVATYIGFLKSKKLKEREYILRETITFLKLVRNEINYNMNVLSNAYEVSRQKLTTSLKDVIGSIVTDMLKSDTNALDYSIVNNVSSMNSLTDYDKNIIISILRNLGRSDVTSQFNIIDNGIYTLENQVKEANTEKLNKERMYKSLGAITGLMIAIIFI